jgi:non-heme chloroperoxidase
MDFEVKTIELDGGLTLQYVESGSVSGIPVILLHGYADSWRSFERVLPYLPGSIHTFALTQRGHGDAGRPDTGYGIHDFAGDVFAFMNALHLGPAVIAGGSSGGFVARCFAIGHTLQTLGLVLIGTPLSLRDKPGVLRMRDSTISGLTDPVDPGFVREFIKSTFAKPVPQSFMETLVAESLKVPARIWKATLAGLLADDSDINLDRITAPTLVVWGSQDNIVPRSDQETIVARIAGSRLVVYSGAGHALYCEEPERLAFDLTRFVAALVR